MGSVKFNPPDIHNTDDWMAFWEWFDGQVKNTFDLTVLTLIAKDVIDEIQRRIPP